MALPRSVEPAQKPAFIPAPLGAGSAVGQLLPFLSRTTIPVQPVTAVPAILPATGSGGWSVSLSYTADTQVHLSATTNQALDSSGMWTYIFDVTDSANPKQVKYCTSGTVCTLDTVPSGSQSTYQAFVGPASGMFTPSQATASSATVTPPAWSITLTANIGSTIGLTATTNYDVSGGIIEIFDSANTSTTGANYLTYCTTGHTCAVSTVPGYTNTSYVAFIGRNSSNTYPMPNPQATSNAVTPPPWKVTLTANIETNVALTATTNYDVSGKMLEIFDSANKATSGTVTYLTYCTKGTSCAFTTVPHHTDTSYVAFIGNSGSNYYPMPNPLGTSNYLTPPPWNISLAASGGTVTATTNYDVSGGMYDEIFDLSRSGTTTYLGWCTSGTTCTKTTSNPGDMFIAGVADNLTNNFPQANPVAVSNQTGGSGPTGPFETAGGSNPSAQNYCYACHNDPINTSNGEFFENYTDLSIKGRGPGLAVGRSYSSQRAPYDGPFGYGWAFSYDMHLSQPSATTADLTQENGSVDHFTQNASGTWQAPSWIDAQLVHNADGTWTFTRKAKELFDLDASGRLLKVRDLNGNTTTITRDAQGRVGSVTDLAGRSLSFAYDPAGHITSATDPANRSAAYGYDGAGHLTSYTDPTGAVTSYAYGAANLLTTVTDANGTSMTNAYDAAHRITSQTDRNGGNTTFAYSGSGGTITVTITSPAGRVMVETYSAGQRTSAVGGSGTPQAATWSYQYDPATFGLTKTTDSLGKVTTQTYDLHGNRTSATDANGHASTFTYDSLEDLTSSTDALGVTTTYTYDTAGNPLTRSTPLTGTSQTATTTLAYSDSTHPGDVTSVTDPDGHATTFTYDGAGDRSTVTDALGNTTAYTFDAIGHMLTSKTPKGGTTTYGYDAAGRLTGTTDPLGKTTAYAYDPTGQRTTVSDALGHTSTTAYDPMGRPVKATSADGTSTSTGYDADGNATATTDASGHTTAYAFDALNRITSSTDPLNRATAYTYDKAGHLTGVTDPSGRTTTYAYDGVGNKTGTTYSDGTTHAESFTYTAANQQATMADATGTTTSTYDSLGRLTTQTNGNGQSIGYTYSPAGQLTAIAYPNGQNITRAHDAAGNLTGITDWAGHTTTFTPDADHNTSAVAYPNGVTSTTAFDAADRISGITHTGPGGTAIASFAYTRNDIGNLTAATTTGMAAPGEAYTYTSRDQLSGVNASTYTYDPAGNVTALATGGALAYDASSQPTAYTLAGTTVNLAYDAQGNRTTGAGPNATTATYAWDQANRLTNANGATATYDATGLRATRTPTSGPTAHYVWDTLGAVPLMLTDGTTSYLYDDNGNPVEQIDSSGAALFYQHDQHGSTRLLTDPSGTPVATYTYDAYGNLTAKTGTADTVLRWNGQAQDSDTGLYYLRHRYYDPQTAQFLSIDPLAAVTRAIYTYANDNPLAFSDPLGLDWGWTDWVGAAGAVVGVAALLATGPVAVGLGVAGVALGLTVLIADATAEHPDPTNLIYDAIGLIPGAGATARAATRLFRAGKLLTGESSFAFRNAVKASNWDWGSAIAGYTSAITTGIYDGTRCN